MLVKHISRDCKCKFNSSTCNLNKKIYVIMEYMEYME